jgi:hypothetical protein
MKTGLKLKLTILAAAMVLVLTGCGLFPGQRYSDFTIVTPLPPDHTLIVGIVGGIERWNDDSRGVPKLAEKIRALHLPYVHVETVENRRLELAVALIKNAFDRNGDGLLDIREAGSARLILFGHSMGGAAVVALAGKLEQMGIPVLMTIQVDSFGRDDRLIPANVHRAVNLFQTEGIFIKGEPNIAAMDERTTRIIGNYKFEYRNDPVDMSGQKFIRRMFNTPHDQMAADPQVWNRVEDLILAQLSTAAGDG